MLSSSMRGCVAAALLLLPAVTRADWAAYRGPNFDGISAETGIAKKWPASGPKVQWKIPTPLGFSSFTVANGRAYTIVTREVQGAPQETVVALDANTGKELWSFPIGIAKYDGGGDSGAPDNKGGDGPRSTPTIDGGKLYALSCNLALVCVDAAKGTRLWARNILIEHGGEMIKWKNAASPVIEGNLLFMAGGGPGQALLALDKNTGKTVWKSQDDKMTHSTPTVATILGVRQVIFFTQKGLVSVTPAAGAVLWRYDFPFKVSTAISPVVCGDIVYCSAGYGVGGGAVKLAKSGSAFTATEIYRTTGDKTIANHWSTPVFKDGYLYGMFQFKEYGAGPMKCVEAATGKVVWEKPGFGPGNVTLVDGHLLALSDAGHLVLVEATPKAYTEVSRAKVLTGKCWSTPIFSGGRVYARSTKEGVCVDVSSKVSTAK
ncbi:MAG TPA: PQQ-binding-like beta-propeller repeat protein [Verrucomicrobiae bacterium]